MQGSSIARGLAVIAVAAVLLVGARALRLRTRTAPRPTAPVCALPIEIESEEGVRLACASELSCSGVRAGDRVAPGCVVERGGMAARAALLTGVPIDVNRASAADLELLDGIGPKIAEAIVHERERAPFACVDDLVRVRGIGPHRLEAMRPFVTVE